MERNHSTETLEPQARSSGSASVLFLVSIVSLACAAFTLAVPGAGDQAVCSALGCDSRDYDGGERDGSGEMRFPFRNGMAQATMATATASDATLPAEIAISAADQHWQVAQSFDAQDDAGTDQSSQVAQSDAAAGNQHPLAHLADTALAIH